MNATGQLTDQRMVPSIFISDDECGIRSGGHWVTTRLNIIFAGECVLPVVTSWGPPPLADHPVSASRSCWSERRVAAAYQPRNVTKNEHITDRETRVQGHGHNRVFVQYLITGCCVNELDRI